MVAKSGCISAVAGYALLPGLRSFEAFAVVVVRKRITIHVVRYICLNAQSAIRNREFSAQIYFPVDSRHPGLVQI